MGRFDLRDDHSCGCDSCIKIVEAYAGDHDAAPYRDGHICACKACISATTDMVARRTVQILDTPHTCGCNACEYNQKLIAEG